MPRPALAALLLCTVVALAGCATDTADPTAVDGASAAGPLDPARGTRTSAVCTQAHHSFPSPADSFLAFLPEGFALVTEDPAGLVVNVRVEATHCLANAALGEADGSVSEVWVELPVTPPEALAASTAVESHTVPVVAYASPSLAALHRARLPDRVFDAEISFVARSGGEYTLTAETDAERYLWEGVLDQGGGAFAELAVARWLQAPGSENGVSGHLQRLGSASTNVGLGGVAMVYQGGGGAPPATAGVVHVVTGLTLSESFVVSS